MYFLPSSGLFLFAYVSSCHALTCFRSIIVLLFFQHQLAVVTMKDITSRILGVFRDSHPLAAAALALNESILGEYSDDEVMAAR